MKKILAVFNIILILIFFIGTTAVYADITEEDISMFPQDVVETFLSPKKRNTGSENIVSKFLHHFYD